MGKRAIGPCAFSARMKNARRRGALVSRSFRSRSAGFGRTFSFELAFGILGVLWTSGFGTFVLLLFTLLALSFGLGSRQRLGFLALLLLLLLLP